MIVRPATGFDLAAIAAIGEACALDELESARDPRYMAHLLARGLVTVAEEQVPIGFAATTDIGGVTMLCDLFVHPDARSNGVGDALLTSSLTGGPRMTFSSKDPRALALYLRHGMTPRWPLLYLAGPPPDRPPSMAIDCVAPVEAAAAEAAIAGIDRADSYAHWASRPSAGAFVVTDHGTWVAAGCFAPGELTHMAVARNADVVAAVMSAFTLLGPSVSLCVPGHRPVAQALLAAGFRIEDFDMFFTSGPDPTDAGLVVAAPGLV